MEKRYASDNGWVKKLLTKMKSAAARDFEMTGHPETIWLSSSEEGCEGNGFGVNILVVNGPDKARYYGSKIVSLVKQKNFKAEKDIVGVFEDALRDLEKSFAPSLSGGIIEEHLQDQLILPMAIAQGSSRMVTGELSNHTRTAIHVAEKVSGAKFSIDESNKQEIVIECEGIGFRIHNFEINQKLYNRMMPQKKTDLENDLKQFVVESTSKFPGCIMDLARFPKTVKIRGPEKAFLEGAKEIRRIFHFYELNDLGGGGSVKW